MRALLHLLQFFINLVALVAAARWGWTWRSRIGKHLASIVSWSNNKSLAYLKVLNSHWSHCCMKDCCQCCRWTKALMHCTNSFWMLEFSTYWQAQLIKNQCYLSAFYKLWTEKSRPLLICWLCPGSQVSFTNATFCGGGTYQVLRVLLANVAKNNQENIIFSYLIIV